MLATVWPADDARVQALRDLLEAPVTVVRGEPRFAVTLEPLPVAGGRRGKGVVVLDDRAGLASTAAALARAPGRGRSGVAPTVAGSSEDGCGYRLARDLWARGQAVLVVTAGEDKEFLPWLGLHGADMVEAFEETMSAALEPTLFAVGEDTRLERELRRRWGFSLRVPRGWRVHEDAAGRVVRLSRVLEGEAPRFLLVHWRAASAAPADGAALLALRDSLGASAYDGDRVRFEGAEAEAASFQGRPAVVLRGLYQNARHLYGGPFVSYAFTRGERFYLVDAAVYNPAGPKLPFLREVRALAQTFRAGETS